MHGHSRDKFTGNPGVKVNISDVNDPLEFLTSFSDDELIHLIAEQTNPFAKQFFRRESREFEETFKGARLDRN